jgi:quercetin dioxygenase-like cupin family protein
LRGAGRVLVDRTIYPVAAHDLVSVAPRTWHQFRAAADAPLGFLCMVDAARDKPELPDADALAALNADPDVAAFLAP